MPLSLARPALLTRCRDRECAALGRARLAARERKPARARADGERTRWARRRKDLHGGASRDRSCGGRSADRVVRDRARARQRATPREGSPGRASSRALFFKQKTAYDITV